MDTDLMTDTLPGIGYAMSETDWLNSNIFIKGFCGNIFLHIHKLEKMQLNIPFSFMMDISLIYQRKL